VAEKSIIISFSFVVKNDVDSTPPPGTPRKGEVFTYFSVHSAFSLGELSGSVKQILGLAKSKAFNYDLKSNVSALSVNLLLTHSIL